MIKQLSEYEGDVADRASDVVKCFEDSLRDLKKKNKINNFVKLSEDQRAELCIHVIELIRFRFLDKVLEQGQDEYNVVRTALSYRVGDEGVSVGKGGEYEKSK